MISGDEHLQNAKERREPPRCLHCGKAVPPASPGGLCPECMVRVGIGSEAGVPNKVKMGKTAPPPPEELAASFPQLEILSIIGAGGMGIVYKARQRSLDRLVALKILPQQANDPGFNERFTREARSLARLNHPNIVAVHEFGEAGQFHFFIMEYVDGLNLRQLQQSAKLLPEQSLGIIPQICAALQYAHNQGVVHRDVKPENVLIDKHGHVKIADFGLAKVAGQDMAEFRLTGAGELVGTPHYMAPEQVERPQTVDHRADIYSLGVVFYEMLTGELPLGRFPPPSQKVQIDVRLDGVVLQALEKEPSRRYQHASELQSSIRQFESGARPPTPRVNRGSLRTHITLGGAVACVGAVLLWAASQWSSPQPSLIGQWTADESFADVVTGIQAVATDVQFEDGVRGKAFRFNGKTSTVNVPRSARLNPGEQLTLEFWMKADPDNNMNGCCQGLVTADFYGIEISPGYTTRSGVNFAISTDSGSTMVCTAEAGNHLGVNGGAVIAPGAWHYIAGTFDGTRLQLYLNGKPWGFPQYHTGRISPMGVRSFLTFGSEDGKVDDPGNCVGNRYFKGLIDEISIHSRALSAAEIAEKYRTTPTAPHNQQRP